MAPLTPVQADSANTAVTRWHVLYPNTYVWYVLVSALDVLFTAVLLHFGGREVNMLANWVLARWDLAGMILFKFVLVAFVICICEIVGRKHPRVGRDLGHWAVGITCIPVILAILQLMTSPTTLDDAIL
jgi:hypothetical protein